MNLKLKHTFNKGSELTITLIPTIWYNKLVIYTKNNKKIKHTVALELFVITILLEFNNNSD